MNEGIKKFWKKEKTGLIIIFIIVSLAVFHAIRVKIIIKEKDQEFYRNFNESFIGKVVKINKYNMFSDTIQIGAGPKYEAFYLSLHKSTIKNYDPRDSTFYVYCIIKDSTAIVFEDSFPEKYIEFGDILYYNGKVDSMFHYKIFYRDTNFTLGKRKYFAKKNKPILVNSWKPAKLTDGNRRLFVESIDDF